MYSGVSKVEGFGGVGGSSPDEDDEDVKLGNAPVDEWPTVSRCTAEVVGADADAEDEVIPN